MLNFRTSTGRDCSGHLSLRESTVNTQIEEVPENVVGWLSKYGVQKLGELQVTSKVRASRSEQAALRPGRWEGVGESPFLD